MGLDVYLYRYEVPFEEYRRRAAVAEALDAELSARAARESKMPTKAGSEDIDWGAAKDQERNRVYWELQKKLRAENDLDEYGEPNLKHKIEEPSKLHPEHYFKVGYFRSSYNESGVDRVLGRMGLGRLGTIFPGDDYERAVDWRASLALATSMRDRYAEVKKRLGNVTVLTVAGNMFSDGREWPTSDRAALELYEAEKAKRDAMAGDAGFGDYSNGLGDWFWKYQFKLTAAIPGKGVFGHPCMYLVGEWQAVEGEKDEGDFYAQALDIVVETIEWVLAQPQPERFLLHWSS